MLSKTIALVRGMEVVVEVNLYEGVGGGGMRVLQEKGSAAKPSARDSVLARRICAVTER